VTRHLSVFVCLSVLISTSVSAQTRCSSPTDQSAFDVGALKSELSVLAVGCSDEDDYNKFVERYRGELVSRDGEVNAWFRRTYGRAAQTRYDSYITLLANAQSEIGLHQGTDFCPRLKPLFAEAMALPDSTVLAQYAAAKDLIPDAAGSCEAASAAPAVRGRSVRHTVVRRHK
jgi:hypothetical protein